MHAWGALTPIEETLRFLDDAVSSGKISYYGFSNYVGWHITKASEIAKARGYTRPLTLQPQYSLLVRDIELEILAACQDAGMGLLPWSPLGGGWLTGKYKRDQVPTGATRLGENPNRGMESYAPRNEDERTWAIVNAVEEIAQARSGSMAQVALAWVAARPAVTSVILGARTPEQLADNLSAAELTLSEEGMKMLSDVSAPQVFDYTYATGGINQRRRKIEGALLHRSGRSYVSAECLVSRRRAAEALEDDLLLEAPRLSVAPVIAPSNREMISLAMAIPRPAPASWQLPIWTFEFGAGSETSPRMKIDCAGRELARVVTLSTRRSRPGAADWNYIAGMSGAARPTLVRNYFIGARSRMPTGSVEGDSWEI